MNWLDLENPQAGGAEIHFFEIFGRLAEGGHAVTLVASGWPGAVPDARIRGIEVRRVGGRHSFALRARPAVRRLLRERTWDVVVEDVNKLPLYLPRLTRLPLYVIVPHLFGGTAFREVAWPMAATVWLAERGVPWAYRRAAFHAISESTRDDLVARGVAPGRIRVIYPGVDTTWFHPDPAVPRATTPAFLYVGRLKRYKGVDTAIRALARVRGEGVEARLDIAGQGDDRSRLEALAEGLGLRESVRFLGYVSEEEKRRLLRRAWATVFPSPKEGWGITNAEAAACGTPAVAADSPGLRESVRHGETGLLVPYDDVAALAAALRRLAADPGLVVRLGAAGPAFAATLSWDGAAVRTTEHLSETIQAARSARGRKE
ncbi:MAG TPA: glycosyltransferase family 4 protein [Gemmatimonadales bacterium]|nr:glycosyltransferase family 4 protein [Gemmatimonadales bacterium]